MDKEKSRSKIWTGQDKGFQFFIVWDFKSVFLGRQAVDRNIQHTKTISTVRKPHVVIRTEMCPSINLDAGSPRAKRAEL